MTEREAKVLLGEHLCDKCVSRKCETECDYAKAHDMTIKALYIMEKLRELRKNIAEKERFYENVSNDNTLYSNGLADAYCTTHALIDEILGDIRRY